MKLTRRDFAAGLAVGITAPYVIGSARAQAATLKIAEEYERLATRAAKREHDEASKQPNGQGDKIST